MLYVFLFASIVLLFIMDPLPDGPRSTLDTVPAIHEDPGNALTESEPATNDDTGNTLMDSAPATNDDTGNTSMDSVSATNEDPINSPGTLVSANPNDDDSVIVNCVNCGFDCSRARHRHRLTLEEVTAVALRWIAPRIVTIHTIVCHSCWITALNESNRYDVQQPSTSSGQRRRLLCVMCRFSLLQTRFHTYNHNDTADIWNVINHLIRPRQLSDSDRVCHNCYRTAQRTPRVPVKSTINLPLYSRAIDTQANCFVPGCQSTQRLSVPLWLRIKLFNDHKHYIPKSCRICRHHLQNNDWTIVETEDPLRTFTVTHVQDFATFSNEKILMNWKDLNTIPEDYFFHWVGLSKYDFYELKNMSPSLSTKPFCNIALAAFLSKLRTGDSIDRLCTIFNVPRSTLWRYLNTARNCLYSDFVPRNLGINHISRADISRRNLTIPKGLFAPNNEPIVIVDGTYIYVQKSSNYLYQKNTYSLHKYRNLIKPVIIVCCDGYIVDALGPYPATTSDAEVMSREFRDHLQPLRQYFQPGDVFILDRGFRDSINLLRNCGYSPHLPSSLHGRETQLSTLAANQSRCVTICRWVVEAINGIMKKCFKVFRHEYFKEASTAHMMQEFKTAAALINRFHRRMSDRDDAQAILNVISEKMYMNNDLGDFVIENNLNRRRVPFENMDINNISFPQLTYSELLLITCGPYQLKQARAYYAEHVRRNGSYLIETCVESSNIFNDFPPAENCSLLRGKIQSRHISRKVYYVYVLHTNDNNGIQSIKQYYCNCMVGRRTVGCCAHVATIIWFFGWARYENNINLPAQHLDDVLIIYEEE